MKKFKYTRDLEGAPIGTVRTLDPTEVEALVTSGALVETDEDPTPVGENTAVVTGPILARPPERTVADLVDAARKEVSDQAQAAFELLKDDHAAALQLASDRAKADLDQQAADHAAALKQRDDQILKANDDLAAALSRAEVAETAHVAALSEIEALKDAAKAKPTSKAKAEG
jgi:hypothetical protein